MPDSTALHRTDGRRRVRHVLAVLAVCWTTVVGVVARAPTPAVADDAFALERRIAAPSGQHVTGGSVALDGDRLVVRGADDRDRPRVLVYRRLADGWAPEVAWTIDLPGAYEFGVHVAISGTTVAVGVPYTNPGKGGAVHVFDVAHPAAEPTVLRTSTEQGFGGSVAIDGDVLAAVDGSAGLAYVYERSAAGWALAPGGGPVGMPGLWAHGISLDGGRIAIGATAGQFGAGSVQLLTRSATEWGVVDHIDVPSDRLLGGALIAGDRIALRAPASGGDHGGSIYLYRADAAGWVPDGEVGAQDFGPMAFDGGVLVFTETYDEIEPRVLIYRRGPSGWVASGPAMEHPPPLSGTFGQAIAVGSGLLAIGVPRQYDADFADTGGSVYVYGPPGTLRAPGPPQSVVATAGARGALQVAWAPPAEGGAIETYRVLVTPVLPRTSTTARDLSVPGGTLTAGFTALEEGVTYQATVTAVNTSGTLGTPSAPSNPVMVAGPPTVTSPYTLSDSTGDDPDPDHAGNEPQSNLVAATLSYVGDEISVVVKVVQPDDPLTAPRWAVDTWLKVWFSPPAEAHNIIFQNQKTNGSPFVVPGLDLIARFELDNSCGQPIFPGSFVNGEYRMTFPARCIGSPPSVRFQVTFHANGEKESDETAVSPPVQRMAPPAPPDTGGYWMAGRDGRVYAFGNANHLGDASAAVVAGAGTATDLEPTPTYAGYWVVTASGRVLAFGDAVDYGSVAAGDLRTDERVTSISAVRSGRGYLLFTDRGRVIALGPDARTFGDASDLPLNGPIVGSSVTPSGNGYYLVGSDGGIFAFGDATFRGSMGGVRLNQPVQSLVPTPSGAGYWLVASDGGVFAFGDATFRGSMGSTPLNRPITGMVAFGAGYLMVGADGGIFNFSDKPFYGSLGADPPAEPIVTVAGKP